MSTENNENLDKADKNLKIPKGQKLEDFDFFELTADMSNSITDKLYRSYHPIIENAHQKESEVHHDENIKNDLHVQDIVDAIKDATKAKIVEKVSQDIAKKVSEELSEQYHAQPQSIEHYTDITIKGLRWFMVPAFLVVFLVILSVILLSWTEGIMLVSKTFSIIPNALNGQSIKADINDIITGILGILDLLLLGSLVVMVLIGGYENTVSRIGMSHDVPAWFGKVSISELKVKVAASIVIISSIHLLMVFMNINNGLNTEAVHSLEYYYPLIFTTLVHTVFVISALILAYMDKWHNNDH